MGMVIVISVFCPVLPSSVDFATYEVNREDLQKKDARMQVNVQREDDIRSSAVPADCVVIVIGESSRRQDEPLPSKA